MLCGVCPDRDLISYGRARLPGFGGVDVTELTARGDSAAGVERSARRECDTP